MSMEVLRVKVESLTVHIKDPAERARKIVIMQRLLAQVEDQPEEILRRDDGSLDGIPVQDVEEFYAKEDAYHKQLRSQRSDLFGFAEKKPETEQDRLNKKGKFGYTQLHLAVVNKEYDKIADLIRRGIDHTIKDNGQSTAYGKAVRMNDQKAVQIFHKFRITA